MTNDEKSVADALVRQDFIFFVLKFFSVINPGKEFLLNWHHKAIAFELMKCETAFELSRLIVNLPTQHGKSEIISVLYVAWRLGRDPSLKFLCVGYSETLGKRLSKMTLQVMQSSEFRRIFPNTVLNSETQSEITTTEGGRRYMTTIHGQITGQPANIIVVDDPHKIDSHLTKDEIEKTNTWSDQTLASRLSKPAEGVIICVMQRVAPNDLTAHYLSKPNEPWRQLKLPLVATEDEKIAVGPNELHDRKKGEILHPEWRGKKDVALLKQHPKSFAAQQQQDPMPDGGVLLKPAYLETYGSPLDHHHFERILIGIDGASSLQEDASYSAMVAVGIRQNKFYILDAWRGHVELPELIKQTRRFIDQIGPSQVVIEYASSGIGLYQTLRPEFKHLGIYRLSPKGSKEDRLNSVLSFFVNGRVLLPKKEKETKAMTALRDELLNAPNGKTDDLVDALTTVLIGIHLGAHNRAGVDYTHRTVSLSFWMALMSA